MGSREGAVTSQRPHNGVDPIELVRHELTTPLAVVAGAAETLFERHDLLEPLQRAALLGAIRRHARLMLALVQRLGHLHDLEGGQQLTLDTGPVDLGELVHDIVRDMTGLVDPPPTIEVEVVASVVVRADRPAIEEIVVILISNAMRHAEDSPIRVTVSTSGAMAMIQVRDHGPGIDPALTDRVFEPYARGAARRPGTGIGLTLGRGLAQAHGGALRLRQPPSGGGCAFHLTLPIAGPPPGTPVAIKPASPPP